ncbi:pseudouridylate synthase TRUB2, mitochondrial [Anopheles ziemanni]|uniref:pseudouridylate synthase TRUB2, mitochondrial n=1 Tax=Anopheles coustani TaxID=139045 RepID=UPI0026595649|nr:pseudouridylate synthase TRUB2, mitochondrial [Anopheles coustani]XP_058174188.1 pseudouridylate synthase TRUB2, mitochondrial [Anopheles ziemanni]
MALKLVTDAPTVWNYLNGLVNLYKPSGVTVQQVRNAIIHNLCRDLNQLEVRPSLQRVVIEDRPQSKLIVRKVEDLSDNVLVSGPRYQPDDVKCRFCANHGRFTSGVTVLGINNGTNLAYRMQQNRPLRVYRVTGFLGKATETHFAESRVTARATINHIGSEKIGKLLASIQASHQRKMFELSGIDIQSQAAYELACGGTIRPTDNRQPMIYGIRLAEYRKPFFTIEVHAINETEAYLGELIHEIGINLKSCAHCTGIRCIRHGHFLLEDSLLKKDWNLQNVISAMAHSNKLIRQHPDMMHQTNPALQGFDEGD